MTMIRLFLGLGISLICFYFAIQSIDFLSLKNSFKDIDLLKALGANLALFACQWFRGQRWARLLKPLYPVRSLKAFEIYSVGNLANLLIPLRGGDFIRAWQMANHLKISKSSVLATVVTERLSDLIFFGFLLGLSLMLYPLPNWIASAGGLLVLGSAFLVLLLLLFKMNYLSINLLTWILTFFLPQSIVDRIEKMIRTFFLGVAPLLSLQEYGWFILETILTWGLQGVFIYILFDAFGFTTNYNLDFCATWLMLALTTVAIIVPSSPSYAGTLHLMIVLSLNTCGVPDTQAFTYAVIFHALYTIDTIILGLYGLTKMHLKFRTLFSLKSSSKN
ncbi:MAG: lysylphosphatidylglycerol synthase transmembrane domain-containing protein [Janthinobacterium lividum]